MTGIAPYTAAGLAARAKAQEFQSDAKADNTRRAYRSDWADFVGWCASAGASPLPASPDDVAAYLASLAATHAPATLKRRLAAIGQAHRAAGYDWRPADPRIRGTLQGLLRVYGRPAVKAAAISLDTLRALLASCGPDARGIRDRALMLIGWAGALRRSELAGLHVEHIARGPHGLALRLIGTKTDQAREGQTVVIAPGQNPDTCPCLAFDRWRALLPERSGPLFRKVSTGGNVLRRALVPDAVAWILRARAEAAGLDLSAVSRFSPHGLRSGFITAAVRAGLRDDEVMPHTRHRDLRTFRGYVEVARVLEDTPTKKVGL
jgi:integrase